MPDQSLSESKLRRLTQETDPFRSDGENPANSSPGDKVAVALSYKPTEEFAAPEVVASGRGFIAGQILKLAFEHGINVREDADLAEILAALDIRDEIPVEAFIAVAEILRYVYASDGTKQPEIISHAHKG